MGVIEKDAARTMIISYLGLFLGYLNKGVLFILILSVEEIGLINLLVAVGMLFAQLSNLGTINSFLRFFPYFRDKDKYHHGFPQLIITIATVGLLLTTIASLLFYNEISTFYNKRSALFVAYYFWVIPIGIGHLLFLLLETYLRSVFKNVFAVFARDVLLRLLVTVSLLLYWFDLISFDWFVVYNSLVYVIPFFILLIYTIRYGELTKWNAKISVRPRFRKIIFNYSLFNYANTLGATFVMTLDAMMITAFLGLEATGVYTTILFLASALQVPYRSLMRVAVPFVPVYLKGRKMRELEKLYKDVSSISLAVSLFMFLMVWVNRVELFDILPEDFAEGVWVFLFIMIGRIVDMFFGINGNILSTSKHYKVDILFTLFLIGIIFGLNYWLIPEFGIAGAAIATTVGLVGYNIMRLTYVWWKFDIHPFRIKNSYTIVFFGIALIVTEYLPSIFDHMVLSIGLNVLLIALLYLVPLYFFKADERLNGFVIKFVRRLGVK